MKKIMLFFIVFFISSIMHAQEKQIAYVGINGETTSMDSAYVIREFHNAEKGSLFTFKDFYKSNGKLKLTGSGYFFKDIIKFHGDFVMYDINGVKTSELSFRHGENIGLILDYFKNGKLHKKSERIRVYDSYVFDLTFASVNDVPNYGYKVTKVHFLVDSLGKVIINDGKGYVEEKLSYLGDDFIEEGNYVDGFRHGAWKGKNLVESKSYIDYYKKGIFKTGLLFVGEKEIKYSDLFTGADYRYRNNHIAHLYLQDIDFYKKYVPGYQNPYRGNYWIGVTLGISDNGQVEEVTFDRPINNQKVKDDLITTLLNMPKWKPATLRGIKVKSKYVCGIPFFKVME